MADTKVSALPAASALDGTEQIPVVQGGVSKRTDVSSIRVIDVVKCMTATQVNATITPAAATALTAALTAGTYLVKVWICYRTIATTTGVQFHLNYTGTSSRCAATWYTLSGSGLTTGIANGIADQATTATAQAMEGKGQRASNVASGFTQGVDTASSDQFAVMEGILIATGAGNLQFMFAAEVAATNAATLMDGTTLTLQKVA